MKKYEALYLHTIKDLNNIKEAYKKVIYELTKDANTDYQRIIYSKVRVYNMVIEDIDNEITLLKLRYSKLGGNPNEQ